MDSFYPTWISLCIGLVPFLAGMLTARAQDQVHLTATPSEKVVLGSAINLTCFVGVNKTNFVSVEFSDNENTIFNFTTSSSGKQSGVITSGSYLSDNDENDSVVWVTIEASLCQDDSPERNFICKVYDGEGEFGSGTAQAYFAEPVQSITIDGTEVCQNGAKNHSLSSDFLRKSLYIEFSALNEFREVMNLTFKIGDQYFRPFASEYDEKVCSFRAVVGSFYSFKEAKEYVVQHRIETASGVTPGTCTITVIKDDMPTTEMETTISPSTIEVDDATTLPEKEKKFVITMGFVQEEDVTTSSSPKSDKTTADDRYIVLYGSTMALIIMVVAVTLLGLIGIWYLYLVKDGRAAPPPLKSSENTELGVKLTH